MKEIFVRFAKHMLEHGTVTLNWTLKEVLALYDFYNNTVNGDAQQ